MIKQKAIIVSCFDWYEGRLKPIKELLSDKYDVVVLMADYNHIDKTYNCSNKDVEYIHVQEYKKNLSISRLKSHYGFATEVYRYLCKKDPALIYALVPPNSVVKRCVQYKEENPNVKIYFDVIDMWPESFPIPCKDYFLPFRIWRKLRDDNLKYADHIFTECELYQKSLIGVFSKISTLYLYKDLKPECKKLIDKEIHSIKVRDQKTIYLGYVGSINHIIDIDRIREIICKISEKYQVVFRIIGDGENVDRLISVCKEAGAAVEYYGKVFDEEKKIKILCSCDYGMNIMKESVKVGLTIKSIDYFSYGLPLINNIKGDTWQLIERFGIGLNYDSENFNIESFHESNNLDMHNEVRRLYEMMFTLDAFKQNVGNVILGD